jgi:hypothetical protein
MTPALITEVNKMKPKLNKTERMVFDERFMRLHRHRDILELVNKDDVIKERYLSSIRDADDVIKCSSSSATDSLQPATFGKPLSNELKKSLETGWFWPICQSYAKENHISQDDMTILAYNCYICFGLVDSIDKSLDESYNRVAKTWSKCKCSCIHYRTNRTLFQLYLLVHSDTDSESSKSTISTNTKKVGFDSESAMEVDNGDNPKPGCDDIQFDDDDDYDRNGLSSDKPSGR